MQALQMGNLIVSTIGFVLIIYLVARLLRISDPLWGHLTEDGNISDKKEEAFSLQSDSGSIPHSPNNASIDKYIDYMACAMRFQADAARLSVYKLDRQEKTLDALLKAVQENAVPQSKPATQSKPVAPSKGSNH